MSTPSKLKLYNEQEAKELLAIFMHEIAWGDKDTAIRMMYEANEKMKKMQDMIDQLLLKVNE